MTKTLTKKPLLPLLLFFLSWAGMAQEYNTFDVRYQNNIKGDLTFIGNNIVNRDGGTATTEPEDAYNATGNASTYNDWLDMQYINVDPANTFSSSSADFTFPQANCNLIRYAGLYWSATYPRDDAADPVGTPRVYPINQVRLRVPGGTYVNVLADDVLFDGIADPDSSVRQNSPYACYADITPLITAMADPTGTYTVADIPSVTGSLSPGGGAAGGWTLVVVYENPTLTGKLITTFDGFARVRSANPTVDINYSGFNTIPVGPVRADIGAAALEGDNRITGDRMRIRAASNPSFTTMSNATNPAGNFFNSNITLNGAIMTNRNPNSINTLGYDTDIFRLNNPANSVIPNAETSATFRFTSTGDQYYPFFNSFNVEIIEPDIVLEKRVEDIAGNDITGLGVNLGQILDYVLTFQNIGNDDADNYTIRDILPINVTLDELNMVLPTGVTYTFNPATRTVIFSIPNNIVEEGDTERSIRMRVQVAENCFDFIDACSDLIQNLAYSTYQGVINDNVITDDPSVTDFNTCGFIVPGATNFLLDDLSDCNFRRTVQLCGDSIILDAGDNFDDYIWVSDDNGNGLLDPSDTILNDGDPDGDPSTLVVNAIGTYIVDKIVADPCKGFKEIFDVELFGSTQTNPIVAWFNTTNGDADPTNDIQGQIVQCSVDGDLLPEIFLCGASDSQLIQINISDAQSIVWETLDESSCSAAPNGCANKNQTCTWNQVGTGSDFTANIAGKYRLVINYQNGCFSRFYFDVYQNNLDIEFNKNDIICTTDGNITITNLGANYGYQLVDIANNVIVVPFSANNGPSFDFTTGQNGSYRVDVVQLDGTGNPISGACIFSTPDIGILERDFQVEIETTPANCNDLGTIKIDVLNVEPNYTYTLRLADGTLVDDETAQPDNTYTFQVNPGDYIVETSTDDGCFDSQNITVARTPDPVLSAITTANIGCTAGTIDLTVTGGVGNPDFNYAIWSKDGTQLYPTVGDIPGGAYQVEDTFTFGWRDTDGDGTDEYFPGEDGDYVFVVVDANNCFAFSNEVTIQDLGVLTIDSISETQPSCSGTNDGAITINISNGVGPFQYSIDNGATYQSTPNFVNLNAGPYNIRVLDSSGCDVTTLHDLSEPFPLSASVGVSRDATCDPNGAEVRITNVVGGTPPYSYSFDGGATYGASTTAILPAGTYTVIVRDASCDFPMTVTVEDTPTPPVVTLTPEVNYNCDGSGVITATPDITTYDYTYELDGVLNTPPTSNVWNNVPPGTYIVRTNYVSQTPPAPSLLLNEDFGYGATIPNPNTTGYFYENQADDVTPSGAPIDPNRSINDYEYAVTDSIARPFGAWLNPVDHTTGTRATDGRYLVINIGAPTPGQVIYQQPINDIIPNRQISISLWGINLLRNGTNGVEPDLTIELRHPGTGALVATADTGSIPENAIWNEYVLSLDPGTNTSLNLVIVTNESQISGNDVAIDDITVFQIPEVCPLFVELPVVVEAGRIFAASVTATTNVSCNGLTDATITFEVENFDATAGFEYSVDGSAFIGSTTSPVTTTAPLGAGPHTIVIRKADETTCSVTLNQNITEPAAVVANASITTPLTCTNGGATITASATGGTPTHTYQLEDTAGTPITSYDFATNGANTVFTGLAAGDYIVRARDANNCEDPIDVALTVAPTNPVEFTVTATACYSGANDATIQVDVTNGNGDYTFSINGNPWVIPTPANSTTHTFTGLANGTYTINVQDGSGCTGVLQTIDIEPQVTVAASAPNITACGTSTDITISAAGGDGNYVFAVVPNATAPTTGDFGATNPVTVNAPGDYDVHVRDNNGNAGFCSAIYTITIVQDPPIAITPTPTDVTCFGGSDGAISIVVDSGGSGPFQYSIDNGTNYQVGSNFPNLSTGTYPVRVRDANGCESTPIGVDVNEPNQLVAEAAITQNYTCLLLGQITVGGVTPTTGGSGNYQYSINGGAWTPSTTGGSVFTDLTDGTHSIRVRDANAISCEIPLADIIIAPLPTEPALSTSISYNCDGTGEVTVLPSDPTYTYSMDAGAFQSPNLFSNVAVGTHTITVNYGSDCTVDTTIIVEDGNAFEASITAFENLDCNADNSGTITISADNFGAGGFQYSVNGGAFSAAFTTVPQQITGLSAQAYTIVVRDFDNPIAGCTVTLNQTLTEPTPVVTTASITEEFTCNTTGATITASAAGGTPTYVYRLEDNVGGIITAYQTGTTFTNLPAGDYIVRARDTNLCEDPIDTAITVVAPDNPTFTATPTACYSGLNDGSILVDVTSLPGNGGFQFSINSGPWMTPTPPTATTYTFINLANGTYTIDVRDAYGCPGAQQTVTINPGLTAVVDVVDVTTCADGSITVTASGGDGSYQYAFVPTTTSPTGLFGASNTFTVTAGNEGTFDVYVRDNSATAPFCEYVETVTINPATPLTITTTPTDPLCHDGVGSIEVNVTSGDNPYTIQIIDLDNGGASDQTNTNILIPITNYYNLAPGNYMIIVTDSNGCTVTNTPVTINNPIELTGSVVPILPAACGSVDPNDYGFQFVGYPTTYPPGTTIEFSADGGATWPGDDSVPSTTDRLMGYISGTNVFPSMRTMVGGVEICRTDLPRYTIPYPLDDLDISISTVVVACNELQVTVQGTAGVPNYEYTYTDDPANFVIGTATWTPAMPGDHTWVGLIPGRTYVFYVRDSTGCIRQSNVNVNDITTNPLEITSTYEPSCSGANDAEIIYTIVDTDGTSYPSMRWEFYNADTGALVLSSGGNIAWNNTITISSLAPAEYYIVVTEVDGGGIDVCVSGSENLLVEELNPITATLNKLSDISCNAPGLIAIENINGGGGSFTFTVTGPAPFVTITATSDNPVAIPANSPAGNYNATITDQFGCFTDLGPIALTLTPNPTIDSMVVDNCASPTSLTINATSTAPQILYSIDGGTTYVDNGGVFNNLTPGNYNIAIIDSNGCTDTDTVDIYPVLEANVSLTKLLDCTLTPDAEITIDIIFGSGSYDYEITNGLGGVVARTTLPSNPYVFQTTVPENYTITIYDDNTSGPECNRVFSIIVPPAVVPAPLITSFTDVTCNGADDGTINVSAPDNGIGPFTFEIISGPGSTATFPIVATSSTNTSATFTGLEGLATPGITYTIRATGSNGCFTDITQDITQPDAIANVSATVLEFACTTANNSNDATITVNPGITGGSGNYVIYEFINDQGTVPTGDDVIVQSGINNVYTETNTAGGTYIINVYDDNGCVGSTTAAIAEFVEISNPTVTITQDITCNPGNDAEVTLGVALNPGAGVATLNYSVVGTDNAYSSLNQVSNVFTALGIGNYVATVTNTNTGCFVETTFEIEDPNNFEISTTTVDVVCFGDNGSVSFTINDPVNPYAAGFTWQIYDSQGTAALGDDVIIPGANGTSANVGPTAPFAIPAGEYRVEITQDSDPSCINNALFTIAGPSAAITANTEVTPITCIGNDGVIEIIDVLGGWGNYQYYVGTVAPTVIGDYFAAPRFENLGPGTYEAWVIDQNGCQQQVQNGIILADSAPITGTLQINQPNCINFSGEVEVVGVTGGQGSNYSYQLIKDTTPVGVPQNTAVFPGLDAGSYQVEITDQWSCTFTTTAELLYEPIVPLATVVKTIDCSATPGGEITITQTGGSGSFNYDIIYPDATAGPSNTTGIFTGLTQVGTYTFTITDQAVGHACSTTITQELQPAIIPVINVDAFTDVTCNGADDGTISVSVVENGVGPYTFEIISGPGSSATFPILPTTSTATTATFASLEGLVVPGVAYTIRATGINSCTADITQEITQPDIIDNVNASVMEFACATGNNSDNASITIDETAITGGSGNYVRYEFINTTTSTTVQNGTNPIYIETNFAGGNYTINVYDDMGCLGGTTAVILPFVQISDPTITTNADVTCNPGDDSEIQVNVTLTPATPVPSLEYTATGTDIVYNSTNATGLFTGLGVGNYIIRVTNLDTSCYVETTHTIADPNIMEVVITKLTDEECLNNGVDDGSFSVTINNYAVNYSYQVYDLADNPVAGFSGTGNTSTPLIISNLVGGGYYVRITQTDAPFCEQDSNAITILAPDAPITANINQETSVACSNDQGSLLVDPEGGEGPYTIVLTNTTTTQAYTETDVEAFIFTGLAAGDYTIEVTDTYSCLYTDAITLIRPDPIVATIAATTLACFGDATASVTATVGPRNMTPTYSYQLNTYDDLAGTNPPQVSVSQASDTFINLPAGFYSITVTDDVGCSEETVIVEIVNPTEVTAQLIRTSPLTCLTGIEFELTASGGLSGSYEYSDDNTTWIAMTGNTATITEPIAGTYRYYVRDAVNGCEAVLSNEITEDPIDPLMLTLDTTAARINCLGESTAIIYADADGGLGNYQYELYINTVTPANRMLGPQSSGEFSGLGAGTYWVNVLSEDCTTAPQQVAIIEPTELTYVEDIVNVTCSGEEDGSITVTLSGGSGGYQYAITPNLDQFDDENVFDELSPGNYTIIAQDQNGCFVELQYTITEPEVLEMTGTTLPEVCAGNEDGSVTVIIIGGTAPYSTSFGDNTNFIQDQVDFTNLAAGSYIVYVRDAMDCEENIVITVDGGVNLNAAVEPVYECTGDTPNNYVNITLEDESVLGDVLYALDSTDAADMQLNPDFRDSAPGTHYIAISHTNGCVITIDFEIEAFEPLTLTLEQNNINEITALVGGGLPNYRFIFDGIDNGGDNTFIINRTDTYVVTAIDENGCAVSANIFMEFIDIEIPNFFTPDGDGLNDTWLPRNIEQYSEILIKVYDRYGRVVDENVIDHNGWDGKYQGSELPSGDYWYVVQLNGETDDREFVGHFTMYR